MESLVQLHSKVSELINDIAKDPNDYYSKYLATLEQIDRILISLDLINQETS